MTKAAIIELHGDDNSGDVVRFTVADGTAISKGTLCKFADPKTATAATGSGEAFAGIASTDKVASDGSTTLGMYTRGIFDIKANTGDGSIVAGDAVCVSGADMIRAAVEADTITGSIVGIALEDATAGEVITVLMGR